MDRKGTNELISGEKSFIAILSNLRVYFVVRLPDYKVVTMHRCIAILGPAITCIVSRPKYRDTKKKIIIISVTWLLALFALFVAHTQRGLCCASFIVSFKGTFG